MTIGRETDEERDARYERLDDLMALGFTYDEAITVEEGENA